MLFRNFFTAQETFLFSPLYFGCISHLSSADWFSQSCHMS